MNIDPGVRPAVRGDPVRLRQVLTNLVSNAIKFTPRGTVDVQVSKRSETRTHSEILFAVRTPASAFAPEAAAKLFQPFSQADASTTRMHGGTGLGLVICKRMVDLMNGKIGVRSELGKGSVFWFSVPLLKALGDVAGVRRNLHGARALVLGSDQVGAESFDRLFRYLGHQPQGGRQRTRRADQAALSRQLGRELGLRFAGRRPERGQRQSRDLAAQRGTRSRRLSTCAS